MYIHDFVNFSLAALLLSFLDRVYVYVPLLVDLQCKINFQQTISTGIDRVFGRAGYLKFGDHIYPDQDHSSKQLYMPEPDVKNGHFSIFLSFFLLSRTTMNAHLDLSINPLHFGVCTSVACSSTI